MITAARGHWDGNRPADYCGTLTLTAETEAQAVLLAALFRFLSTGENVQRVRLLAAWAGAVEAEEREAQHDRR